MTRKTAPRTARKSAAKGGARQRIFRTAAELFYREGIRAIGVETIAAEANTTKMTLYRNFPSKDQLVAEWLRAHDAAFWQGWNTMLQRHPDDPRRQLGAAFELLAKHVAEPGARGCPMANAAVEITQRSHPARKVIEAHKASLRARLRELCQQAGAAHAAQLADQLFLLMEGAQVSVILGVRGPAKSVGHAADALIRVHLGLPAQAQRPR